MIIKVTRIHFMQTAVMKLRKPAKKCQNDDGQKLCNTDQPLRELKLQRNRKLTNMTGKQVLHTVHSQILKTR